MLKGDGSNEAGHKKEIVYADAAGQNGNLHGLDCLCARFLEKIRRDKACLFSSFV